MNMLNAYSFQMNLSFLKRVSRQDEHLNVIICEENEFQTIIDDETHPNHGLIQSFQQQTETDLLSNSFIQSVPSQLPKFRQELELWSKIWPISYTPPPPTPTPSEEFNVSQKKFILDTMKECKRLSAQEQGANIVMIVDPLQQKILSLGRIGTLICDHPVMEALRSAALTVIQSKQSGEKRKGMEGEEEQYLCKGFYLFSIQEPCIMCGMAILHSRFDKVFYSTPSCERGAFESRYSIHEDGRLNHSFQVYRITS